MSVHFSSKSDKWETPKWLFNLLDDKYSFNLDPCASHETAKCKNYFTPQEDGLNKDWIMNNGRMARVFMNPPYGREIAKWIKKAWEESQKNGALVICLIPARTDTSYWHDYIFPFADTILFIRGRLKFGGHKNPAPFPSAVVKFETTELTQEIIPWNPQEEYDET